VSLPEPAAETETLPAAPDAPAQPAAPASVADAFADFSGPKEASAQRADGAVDIAQITPPREVAKGETETAEAPEPAEVEAKPAHPSRHWVQIATGQNRDGLAYDWRRLTGDLEGNLDGKGPFTAPWGEAHRLLAGPFDSLKSAREMVKTLQELGLDCFAYTSPEGQEVTAVK
jgi:hypothetical protein